MENSSDIMDEIEKLRKENEYLKSYIYPRFVGKFIIVNSNYPLKTKDCNGLIIDYGIFKIMSYSSDDKSFYLIGIGGKSEASILYSVIIDESDLFKELENHHIILYKPNDFSVEDFDQSLRDTIRSNFRELKEEGIL